MARGWASAGLLLLAAVAALAALWPSPTRGPGSPGPLLDRAAFVPVARPRSSPTAAPGHDAPDEAQRDFRRALGDWENTTPPNPLQYR
jgi:hypothetical protein